MATNLNVSTKRKQLSVLIGVIIVSGLAVAGFGYYNHDKGHKVASPPKHDSSQDMTGVVTNTFNQQMESSALTQQQQVTAAIQSQLDKLTVAMSKDQESKDKTIALLTQQIQDLKKSGGPQTDPQVGSQPMNLGQGKQEQWKVNVGSPTLSQGTGNIPLPANQGYNPNQGAGFYPGAGPATQRQTVPLIGGIKKSSFTWGNMKKDNLPWIPSGSFIQAIMIEGADANASVTGQQSTTPVVFTLQGNVSMPNGQIYNLDQCRVTGEIWGDISSERGEVRTKNLSCILKDKKIVDMPFEGHVSYEGKEGVRGKPVMRNGKIIGYAGAAGFLSGIGSGIQSAGTTTVGLGASAQASPGDILKQGFGGGASKAADTMSQYWIKRAEQYHPVIDIGAGNAVTVVFQQGFQLSTIEDSAAHKVQNQVQKASDSIDDDSSSNNQSASNHVGSNIDPDEILKQAKSLRLGDTIPQ
ncbi:hypothetical protein BS639_21150 [Rouxiella silvae]|uniref:Conjugal transfer protein TraB n=1 Tax=Rouxiella silvae TaxID=1646373 RepID=A0ABX3TVT1_9GAMM|nr:F-type conjugal transfer pilus assembly protein TraB [Rouxiella silvae]ORJ19219.1 hypothetical protein BS639_21150 [Rouxiella silvae]